MNHVLVGYDRYVEILDRMPTNWWGRHRLARFRRLCSDAQVRHPGIRVPVRCAHHRYGGRKRYPPAAHAEHIRRQGRIRGISQPRGIRRAHDGSPPQNRPQGGVFLASGKVQAPVVGASKSDVLALVARGARDTNELRQIIQDYLDIPSRRPLQASRDAGTHRLVVQWLRNGRGQGQQAGEGAACPVHQPGREG